MISALGAQGFPVPRVHGLCEDESVIGTPFFVMDMVEGRIVWEAHFPGLTPAERAAHFDAMNATIAAAPQLRSGSDRPWRLWPAPTGFVERQVARWSKQYLGDAEAGRVPRWTRWSTGSASILPPDSGDARVVHGDFRCDNMIFAADRAARRARCSTGNCRRSAIRLADFVYHLLMYRMPAGMFTGLAGLDLAALGIPSEEDYVAAYCRRTGREALPDLDYLIVFVMFRLAAILHGIKGRLARGNASSAHAAAMVGNLEPLAELALAQARAAKL